MPAFLSGIFGSVVAWLGQWFTKKVAMAMAASATFIALTLAMWAALKAIVAGLSFAVPGVVSTYFAMAIPENFSACVSALLAARMARTIYDWHVENLKLISMSS